MAFEQTAVNYAAEYFTGLRGAFPYYNYFTEIYMSPESANYKTILGSANEVKIPSLTVKGAQDRTRGTFGGTHTRNVNNEWKTFKLEMERRWDTTLDPLDISQTSQALAVANATKVFNEQQMLPEMAAYAAQKMYSLASTNSTLDETALTKDNILETWDDYIAQMQNARCQMKNIIAYVTPTTLKALKNADSLTRLVSTANEVTDINRIPNRLDGIPVKPVSEDIMQSAFTFTEGWVKGGSAKQINLILVDLTAVFAPILFNTAMTQAPEATTENNWYLYIAYAYGMGMHDERKGGLIVNAAAA